MEISWEVPYEEVFLPESCMPDLQETILRMVYLWKFLTFGKPVPRDNFFEAYHTAMAIWLKALCTDINSNPMIMRQALSVVARYGVVEIGGASVTLEKLRDKALEGGVDYMLDAWFAGCPIEYILG